MKRFVVTLGGVAALFFAPLALARLTYPPTSFDRIETADAALVFGARVRSGSISPLHAERLNAAKALYDAGKVERIVASNAPRAAQTMADYLVAAGIPEDAIEIDGTAIKTPDTCAAELTRQKARSVIFVSQSFHLPRLSYHCDRLGVTGQSFAAERFHKHPNTQLSLFRIAQIRVGRHAREAGLIWAVVLGLYT